MTVAAEAWQAFCDRMAALGPVIEAEAPTPAAAAEGVHHLANQVACWLTYGIGSSDPMRPVFFRSSDPVYEWGGPNADQVQFGDYCWTKSNDYGITVLRGLRERLGNRVKLNYAKGCELAKRSTKGFAAAVAAASIVAKVTRGRVMCGLHEAYPMYGFDRHVGYATVVHQEAICEHGVCVLHRLSFASAAYQQLGLGLEAASDC